MLIIYMIVSFIVWSYQEDKKAYTLAGVAEAMCWPVVLGKKIYATASKMLKDDE